VGGEGAVGRGITATRQRGMARSNGVNAARTVITGITLLWHGLLTVSLSLTEGLPEHVGLSVGRGDLRSTLVARSGDRATTRQRRLRSTLVARSGDRATTRQRRPHRHTGDNGELRPPLGWDKRIVPPMALMGTMFHTWNIVPMSAIGPRADRSYGITATCQPMRRYLDGPSAYG